MTQPDLPLPVFLGRLSVKKDLFETGAQLAMDIYSSSSLPVMRAVGNQFTESIITGFPICKYTTCIRTYIYFSGYSTLPVAGLYSTSVSHPL